MAAASIKVEFPRRQAMLTVYEECGPIYPWQDVTAVIDQMQSRKVIDRVPVFVWPMPTLEGLFVVEHQDGHCQRVQPYELTFLGSKELFDQYDWKNNGNA